MTGWLRQRVLRFASPASARRGRLRACLTRSRGLASAVSFMLPTPPDTRAGLPNSLRRDTARRSLQPRLRPRRCCPSAATGTSAPWHRSRCRRHRGVSRSALRRIRASFGLLSATGVRRLGSTDSVARHDARIARLGPASESAHTIATIDNTAGVCGRAPGPPLHRRSPSWASSNAQMWS
jgi:hypothetical protein